MTEITQQPLQSQIIQEEPFSDQEDVNSILEEEDITETTVGNLHFNRPPSPIRDTYERLHQNGGSDSEEDMTEENVQRFDVGEITSTMDSLSTVTAENAAEETDAETAATSIREHEEQEENSHIPATVHEQVDPEQVSSDNHSIGPTDTVNSVTMPTAASTATSTPTSNGSSSSSSSSSNHKNSSTAHTTHNSPPSIRGRSASSASPTTLHGGLLPRSQRVWEMDRQAPECRRCHRRFNFLVRRHHCRRCGQIVCDKCSSNRIRLPVEELIEDPIVSPSQYPLLASQSQRVCDTCYREPIRRSSESHQRRGHRSTRPMAFGSQMRRTDSNQSLMIDCPVCGITFLGMQKSEQEEHLQRCLNVGSPPVQSPRYIVYQLSQESTQIGDECPICFEEFEQGKLELVAHPFLKHKYQSTMRWG
ncbi:hypothetical protein [Parasitella parasitica]|uniref:FYVE-type domain-containing protein n=1 Tax=Parasitella parasitica TaxID=35722 RepID=A0A0B7MV33_9FUNG|nr:hypothetical protein [Parasitella parasitica]